MDNLICERLAAVGLLFGWCPAKRPADLEPVEVLHYE